jgi:hypothetical protein
MVVMKRERDDDDYSDGEDGFTMNDSTHLAAMGTMEVTMDWVLYKETCGEIHFKPFFQRNYKWTHKQASLCIESVCIGYPLPDVTFLKVEEGFVVFDGAQRLTSMKLFTQGTKAPFWPKPETAFELKNLPVLKNLEGKTYKDLSKNHQAMLMREFKIKIKIIPDSWPLMNVLDYFSRIQGGGTKMTDQELRRAITRGGFTDLLDALADAQERPFYLLKAALDTARLRVDPDELQGLFLRFFTLHAFPTSEFGMPSIQQQSLDTMKTLNRAATNKVDDIKKRLKNAIETVIAVFTDKETMFRRPCHLGEGVPSADLRVWVHGTRINKYVWDALLVSISRVNNHKAVVQKAAEVRDALIHVMQTHPSFGKMKKETTEARIMACEAAIRCEIEVTSTDRRLTSLERSEAIRAARANDTPCHICSQRLSKFNELCHVDHIIALANGGKTHGNNLGVTHKACNLAKGAN